MQHEPACPRGVGLIVGEREQPARHSAPTGGLADRETAELGGGADEQQPAGREHGSILHGDQVDRVAVTAVALLALGDALLDAEHVVADLQQLRHLRLAANAPDLDRGGVAHPTPR